MRIGAKVLTIVAGLSASCHRPAPTEPRARGATGTPPAFVLGTFEDDYGSRHSVSPQLWVHDRAARYEIVRWNPQGRYLVAHNHPDNPSDGGKWTRIDWFPLTGMEPYSWAFCMSAYAAATRADAEATNIADRSQPESGCNGFPFTRMARTPTP